MQQVPVFREQLCPISGWVHRLILIKGRPTASGTKLHKLLWLHKHGMGDKYNLHDFATLCLPVKAVSEQSFLGMFAGPSLWLDKWQWERACSAASRTSGAGSMAALASSGTSWTCTFTASFAPATATAAASTFMTSTLGFGSLPAIAAAYSSATSPSEKQYLHSSLEVSYTPFKHRLPPQWQQIPWHTRTYR